MSTLIIHHHDLDGYIAGDIALFHYPDAETLSLNYDHPELLPTAEELQARYSRVIIVDYSLPPETMLALKDKCEVIWIDHHVSAIQNAVKYGYAELPGLRTEIGGEKLCGGELAWLFFEKRPLPRFVKLVGEYDTYRHSHEPFFQSEVMPFFYGSQLVMDQLLPANAHNDDFLASSPQALEDDKPADDFIRNGLLIQKYNCLHYKALLKESSFVKELWGLRVLCFNCAGHGSANMQPAFDPTKHDAMMLFSFNGARWSYGLYTDERAKPEVNLANIAVQYGGGGHRCACGFSTDALLPELTSSLK